MERTAWLQEMRDKAEALYDHFSPFYWVKFGLGESETHRAYLQHFLDRVAPITSLEDLQDLTSGLVSTQT